jgi:hypothetical protein
VGIHLIEDNHLLPRKSRLASIFIPVNDLESLGEPKTAKSPQIHGHDTDFTRHLNLDNLRFVMETSAPPNGTPLVLMLRQPRHGSIEWDLESDDFSPCSMNWMKRNFALPLFHSGLPTTVSQSLVADRLTVFPANRRPQVRTITDEMT